MFCKRNDGVKGHLHTDDKPPVPAGLGTAHRQYPPIEAHIYQSYRKIYYNSIIPLPLCDTRPHEESGFLFSGIGQEPPMIW